MPAPGETLKEKLSTPTLRSSNGRQPLTQHRSNPSYGFGSSLREDVTIVSPCFQLPDLIWPAKAQLPVVDTPTRCSQTYTSTEADRAKVKSMGGNQSQGAIYNIGGACGKQLEKESAPEFRHVPTSCPSYIKGLAF